MIFVCIPITLKSSSVVSPAHRYLSPLYRNYRVFVVYMSDVRLILISLLEDARES